MPSRLVKRGVTYANSVIPKCNIILFPLVPDMAFLCCRNDLVEIVDDSIALSFGNADNLRDEAWIEEYRLPTCNWIRADEWMFRDDWLTANGATQRP